VTFQIQNKSKLAVAALIDIALRQQDGPVVLSDVGQRQQISQSYMELMFKALLKSGLVVSARGPGGGYSLARPAEEISVAEVLAAVSRLTYQPTKRASSSMESGAVNALDDVVHVRAAEILGDVTILMLAQLQMPPNTTRFGLHTRPPRRRVQDLSVGSVANSVFDLANKLSK
jgi:Rrf2 family iron-sulfur cluster assembly transcriptional regulator